MGTNNFLVFNPAAANQETDVVYASDPLRTGGAPVDAIVPSPLLNKVLHQTSAIAQAIGQLLADVTGQTINDSNVTTLLQQLAMAISGTDYAGTSGGAANIQTLSPTIVPISYQIGASMRFLAGFTNTAAMTMNVSGLGALNVFKATPTGPAALSGGEVVAGTIYTLVYDGTNFQLSSPGPKASFAAPGYFRLPSGLIFQWGLVDLGGDVPEGSYGPFSFPIPFPNACLNIQFTTYVTDNGQDLFACLFSGEPPTATQFWFFLNLPAGANNRGRGATWFAVGF